MKEALISLALPLTVLCPLVLAVAMAPNAARSTVARLAPWAPLPALLLAVFPPSNLSLSLPWLLLGTRLALVNDTARLFLLFTALLWLLSGIYARAYFSGQQGIHRFFVYFLLSMTGNIGLILAQDLTSFYLFFTLMSFASYGLVVHERSSLSLHAGRIYIILVVIGEVALFSALVLATTATKSTAFHLVRQGLAQAESRDLIMLLALIGFGIKAGVLGLHMWLPLAHPVAPTPASAVLSGAMIKSGLLGWLQLLPLGEVMLLQWGQAYITLGLAAAFYGVFVGLTQRDPKTLLAYSSISQMGILTMAVGLGLMSPAAYPVILPVITLYALHHGLSKGALFLGVGVIRACSGAKRRRVWLAMWLPALALAGAPLTSGMAAKFLLKAQIGNAPDTWVVVLQKLLPASGVATALLVGRCLILLHQSRTGESGNHSARGLVWPWALLVTAVAVLPWWFVPETPERWIHAALTASLWPVLLGAVLAIAAVGWRARLVRSRERVDGQLSTRYPMPQIPPGDILVPISRWMNPALTDVCRLAEERLPMSREVLLSSLKKYWSNMHWQGILATIESSLRHWPTALVILVLLGLLAAALAIIA